MSSFINNLNNEDRIMLATLSWSTELSPEDGSLRCDRNVGHQFCTYGDILRHGPAPETKILWLLEMTVKASSGILIIHESEDDGRRWQLNKAV